MKGLEYSTYWYTKFLKNLSIGSLDYNTYFFKAARISHLVYTWCWINGKRRWYLTYLYICCWLWDSIKGLSYTSWEYSSVIDTSIIFLFGPWHFDAVARGVDFLWTKYITDLNVFVYDGDDEMEVRWDSLPDREILLWGYVGDAAGGALLRWNKVLISVLQIQ